MTMIFLLHEEKEIDENADTHSGTFGCPNTQATALQPIEPSFCHCTDRISTIKG